MKEKYDLSLDNRQVVSLLVGALVVLGAVFVLGVVVGKKLATSGEAAQAPDLLSALDARAEAHARTRTEETPVLTFPDELTRKATPGSAAAAPESKPVVTIDVPAAGPASAAGAEAPAELAAAAKPEEAKPVAEKPEAEKSAAKAGEGAVVAASTRKPSSAPVPTRVAQTGTTRPAVASRAALPTGTAANGAFTLQLSASQSREEADRFAQKLRERGYAPFIVEAQVPGKGTWYRVRMGRFPTKEAAGRYLADFKRETRMDAFITSAN